MGDDSTEATDRFRDPRVHIYDFVDEVLVRCPECDQCAVVYSGQGLYDRGAVGELCQRCRLHCPACGSFRDKLSSSATFGPPADPFFRLPLWLQTDTCGHVLWAYNVRHLDLLEAYVGARLRERGGARYADLQGAPTSMLERLPTWLKSAKNRPQILRSIARMRASLPRS